MSSIDAINSIRWGALITPYKDKLTAATRAKLIALGVDTSNIKTETQGKQKLQEVLSDNTFVETKPDLKEKRKTKDPILEAAKSLADKLDVSHNNSATVTDIIDAIKLRVNELKTNAGEDYDKNAHVAYYEKELSLLENSYDSNIDLNMSLNLTANINMFFHRLY